MVWIGEGAYLVVLLLLVGVDEHEAVVGKIGLELVGQFGKGTLVGDAAFACRDHHKQVVGVEFVAEGWEVVPRIKYLVVIAHTLVAVAHIAHDEVACGFGGVEVHLAAEVFCHAGNTVDPSVEAFLVLSLLWYCHHNLSDGVGWDVHADDDELPRHVVNQSLCKESEEGISFMAFAMQANE